MHMGNREALHCDGNSTCVGRIPKRSGDAFRLEKQTSEQGVLKIEYLIAMFSRNEQQVTGVDGADVHEGDEAFVILDNVRWQFPRYDSAYRAGIHSLKVLIPLKTGNPKVRPVGTWGLVPNREATPARISRSQDEPAHSGSHATRQGTTRLLSLLIVLLPVLDKARD